MFRHEIFEKYQLKSLQREGEFYSWLFDDLFNRFKKIRAAVEIIGESIDDDTVLFVHEVSQIMSSLESISFDNYIYRVETYNSDTLYEFEEHTYYNLLDPNSLSLLANIDYRLSLLEDHQLY